MRRAICSNIARIASAIKTALQSGSLHLYLFMLRSPRRIIVRQIFVLIPHSFPLDLVSLSLQQPVLARAHANSFDVTRSVKCNVERQEDGVRKDTLYVILHKAMSVVLQ